jgi:hypothetical protein
MTLPIFQDGVLAAQNFDNKFPQTRACIGLVFRVVLEEKKD